ncbi:DUF3494 domain-containing protein [Streptosporangiaceae bacterium NEAU-GS5]|nr:DUF3494 domain-containing protein [Streptosporangiaceae bacterium NEAU-GS5]
MIRMEMAQSSVSLNDSHLPACRKQVARSGLAAGLALVPAVAVLVISPRGESAAGLEAPVGLGTAAAFAGGAQHVADAVALQAQSDLTTAYNDAAGRTPATMVAGDLVGLTLPSGIYKPAMGYPPEQQQPVVDGFRFGEQSQPVGGGVGFPGPPARDRRR